MVSGKVRVLLVEDNPTDALLVKAVLESASLRDGSLENLEGNGGSDRRSGRGYSVGAPYVSDFSFEVVTVDRLGAAIDKARTEHFDVMLLDLGLPDTQGLQTFERAHAAITQIPIVVLSGLGDNVLAVRAVQQGAQDYLPKAGVLDDRLPRAIRYAVERHRAETEKALVAAELRRRNEELEEELQMAREVQQALLPHIYPNILTADAALKFAHCYRPAATLSGDFFSILSLSSHRAGVLICDVMGHGVRAALIGSLLRGFLDQFLPQATEPGRFLSSVNGLLTQTLQHSGIDAFVTAFYFVADLERGKLLYANAGHPSALVLRRTARRVDWLRREGHASPPLGLLSRVIYPTSETELGALDSIVSFTDGLPEAENISGEQFGCDRILEEAAKRLDTPCERLVQELVGETQRFAGRADFSDDVCLVGMDVIGHGKAMRGQSKEAA